MPMSTPMPDISLTQFVDFVIKAGSPKLTAVRQIMTTSYSPASDFWKAACAYLVASASPNRLGFAIIRKVLRSSYALIRR